MCLQRVLQPTFSRARIAGGLVEPGEVDLGAHVSRIDRKRCAQHRPGIVGAPLRDVVGSRQVEHARIAGVRGKKSRDLGIGRVGPLSAHQGSDEHPVALRIAVILSLLQHPERLLRLARGKIRRAQVQQHRLVVGMLLLAALQCLDERLLVARAAGSGAVE